MKKTTGLIAILLLVGLLFTSTSAVSSEQQSINTVSYGNIYSDYKNHVSTRTLTTMEEYNQTMSFEAKRTCDRAKLKADNKNSQSASYHYFVEERIEFGKYTHCYVGRELVAVKKAELSQGNESFLTYSPQQQKTRLIRYCTSYKGMDEDLSECFAMAEAGTIPNDKMDNFMDIFHDKKKARN